MDNKPVAEAYTCECGCGDTVSDGEFTILDELRYNDFPDEMLERFEVREANHTPLDDFKVYERCGSLVLCYKLEVL